MNSIILMWTALKDKLPLDKKTEWVMIGLLAYSIVKDLIEVWK